MMINRRRVYGGGEVPFEEQYLTIVSKADNNTIGWKASDESIQRTISISIDGGQTWISKESSTGGTTLATLDDGDKLLIKGSNSTYGTSTYYNCFTSTQNFDVQGNIMSLIYGDNFIGETSLSGGFRSLFYQTSVVNAQNLKLPATTLPTRCYYAMFDSCTSLVTAPELSATTLANYCYREMFINCTALTTAPELPATILATGCYYSMFQGCSSLTTAPELPATTLVENCYRQLFGSCSSLNYIKCLATNISASNCTSYWLYLAQRSGTFVKNADMDSWTRDVHGIPTGWTVIDE